ncbi:MAG TPA: hypothetical protein VEQ38_02815 [Verrucomicrobiae bacterium]|nr:hypothetical protein [Verrucomicrobiae bacterium]
MLNALSSESHHVKSPALSGPGFSVALGLAVWFVLVVSLGAGEVFVTPSEAPPLALLIAVTAPILVFLAASWVSQPFRKFVFATDLRFMTAIQAWRIGGFSFLALYLYGILPGYFAWPAGLGDMMIGITAPWIIAALMRRPSFAASNTFVAWNVFGILDLVIAVGMGALGPLFLGSNIVGPDATAAMSRLPLVLVPAFFVPIFIILHVVALSQARRFAGARRS